MVLEQLIDQMGQCGWFQTLVIVSIVGTKLPIAFSIMLPSFSGLTPDWWCSPPGSEFNETVQTSTTFEVCPTNGTECTRAFSQDMITIVSQWDLVCNHRWVNKIIISVQMAGVLVGVITAGQLSEMFGRKPVFYFSLLAHAAFCLIGAFSVTWEMYAAIRFLIGGTCGAVLVAQTILTVEFIGSRWRPVIQAFPSWQSGVCILALFAWLFPNWSHLHLFCALITLPFLATWFFIPESMRWLTVKGRLEEAELIVEKIAKCNRSEKPADTAQILKQVADEERKELEKNKKYSYIDVFRGWRMIKKTLCLCFLWFSCSTVYYGISYNVQKMSGNVYINVVLLAVVEIPADWVTFFLLRSLGRKWTAFGLCLLTGVSGVGTLTISLTANSNIRGILLRILAVAAKFCIGGAWDTVYLYTTELYPTVIRSIGFGTSQTFARVGGIVAPMILMVDTNIIAPYVIMGILMLVSSLCLLTLPETKDKSADDILHVEVTAGKEGLNETEKLNVTSVEEESHNAETCELHTIGS